MHVRRYVRQVTPQSSMNIAPSKKLGPAKSEPCFYRAHRMATTGSPNTLPHSPTAQLLVINTEPRS